MEADSSKHGQEANGSFDIPPEIILDVAEGFCPLRCDVSASWKATLQDLRKRFCESAGNQERLSCVLTHSVVPEWPKRPDGPYPPEVDGMEPIAMGCGPSRWPQQFFVRTENNEETVVSELAPMSGQSYRLKMLDLSSKLRLGDVQFAPFVGENAVHNITGNPILFSNGEPVAMRQGIEQNYFVHAGGAPHQRITSISSFFSLAAQAGQCLESMPASVNRILWHQWLAGFRTIGDKGMWISALFELAWQPTPGPSLAAKKFAWSGTTNVALDELPQAREQAKNGAGIDAVADIPDPPSHWYSVIDDLVSASIAAIDILLALGEGNCDDQDEASSVDAPEG